MMRYDHVIIGFGICGATAAETIRKRDPDGSILIIGDETHPLYSRVLLPHVVRGKTGEGRIFLKQDAAFKDLRIDVRRGMRVTHIDTAAKTVAAEMLSLRGSTYSSDRSDPELFTYNKLLIATGGTPRRLDCDGAEAIAVQRLQTVEDAREVAAAPRGTAVVIGGGFIALELIMSYAQQGSKVVALLRKDGFFSSALDDASKRMLTSTLQESGVDVRTNVTVTGLRRDGSDVIVQTSDGATLSAQTIGAGIGLDANIGFLAGSGIETRAGVITDALLRTGAPDVYAAGDVAEFLDPLVDAHHAVGNWQNAVFQGRLAGENMTGGETPFSRVTSYAITCFGLPISFLGATDVVADQRIVRDNGKGMILQLLIKGERVVGATCIGAFPDRVWVNKLIEERIKLAPNDIERLRDITYHG